MSKADQTAHNVGSSYHPVFHYDSPEDVLNDTRLSTDEKRVILSSWASDMYVVESQPALRGVPGIPHPLRLDDILTALKRLDEDSDPSPRGGVAMRLPRFSRLDCAASSEPQYFNRRLATTRRLRSRHDVSAGSRWTREANVRRYRKLLNTQLTDIERSFIERRLAEELRN